MDVENPSFGLFIRHRKLNFPARQHIFKFHILKLTVCEMPVNPAGSDEGRIQCVNSVCRHHHLGEYSH